MIIYAYTIVCYTPNINLTWAKKPIAIGQSFPSKVWVCAFPGVLAQHRHRVGLVYASAVPVNAYLNQCAEVVGIEFFFFGMLKVYIYVLYVNTKKYILSIYIYIMYVSITIYTTIYIAIYTTIYIYSHIFPYITIYFRKTTLKKASKNGGPSPS